MLVYLSRLSVRVFSRIFRLAMLVPPSPSVIRWIARPSLLILSHLLPRHPMAKVFSINSFPVWTTRLLHLSLCTICMSRYSPLSNTAFGKFTSHVNRLPISRTRKSDGKNITQRLRDSFVGDFVASSFPPSNVILYFHGGGFVVHSPRTYRCLTTALAEYTQCSVAVPHYSLAPDCPFPHALLSCLRAYASVLKAGVPSRRVIFGGDSAGANLALASMLAIAYGQRRFGVERIDWSSDEAFSMQTFDTIQKELVGELPVAAFLFSPWLDLTGSLCKSRQTNKESEKYLTLPWVNAAANMYCPETEAQRQVLVSPLFTCSKDILQRIPSTLFEVSNTEIFRDDSINMYRKLCVSHGLDPYYRTEKSQTFVKLFPSHREVCYREMLHEPNTNQTINSDSLVAHQLIIHNDTAHSFQTVAAISNLLSIVLTCKRVH